MKVYFNGERKALEKVNTCSCIKKELHKLGTKGNYLNIIRQIY